MRDESAWDSCFCIIFFLQKKLMAPNLVTGGIPISNFALRTSHFALSLKRIGQLPKNSTMCPRLASPFIKLRVCTSLPPMRLSSGKRVKRIRINIASVAEYCPSKCPYAACNAHGTVTSVLMFLSSSSATGSTSGSDRIQSMTEARLLWGGSVSALEGSSMTVFVMPCMATRSCSYSSSCASSISTYLLKSLLYATYLFGLCSGFWHPIASASSFNACTVLRWLLLCRMPPAQCSLRSQVLPWVLDNASRSAQNLRSMLLQSYFFAERPCCTYL